MQTTRRAVIDIGTNSVKLLVAEVTGTTVTPVWEGSEQTRLGAGFYETHRLRPEPIAETARAVADFAAKARGMGAVFTRVIATSAARDAVNQADLIDAVQNAAGLKVEVISGDQEAEWAFRGVMNDPDSAHEQLLLLDVGGGSTEFILGRGTRKDFSGSFKLGSVRLLEALPPDDPPTAANLAANQGWVREFLNREVIPALQPALKESAGSEVKKSPLRLVGTGGTVAILARMEGRMTKYDRNQIEGMHLGREQIQAHLNTVWSLPLATRQNIIGLPPERADVILTGLVIYDGVMAAFGIPELQVSTRGLRFAAVLGD